WSCSFVLAASVSSAAADLIGFGSARLRAASPRLVVRSALWFAPVGLCCAARKLTLRCAAVTAAPQASALRPHSPSGLAAAVSRFPGNAQLSVPPGFGTIRAV